jgi:DNA polymerase-3 subunit delta'
MSITKFNDQNNSLVLFELADNLDFLIKLYNLEKLPKILMLTGKKGIGKFTLINHFLNYVYDKDNYDLINRTIKENTSFYKEYTNNIFENIIYLDGSNFKNIKVDDIRDLKSKILKTTISKKERFIVLDDIEQFNTNSLNALLKIIEEPTLKNYFILINNKTKSLPDTLYSRAIEIKILIKNKTRVKIIESLIKQNNLETYIDFHSFDLTPGNFLSFNKICEVNKINLNDDFLVNLNLLLNLYKKDKNANVINMIFFITEYYFYNLQINKNEKVEKIMDDKNFVMINLNKFTLYNLNQNSLFNAISNKISNG